jgi:peptidoglycan-associated lipoprotein
LGERRAKAAQDYIIFLGITPERVSTVSYGEEKPFDPAHNEAAWSKNRRAHFAVLEE